MTTPGQPHRDDLLGQLAAGAEPTLTPGPTSRPSGPDASVRPAIDEDVRAIVDIQFAAWQGRGLVTADDLRGVDRSAVEEQWRDAISRPPSARHRVLTAVAGPAVVGFLAVAPATTDDPQADAAGEIIAMEIAADRTREGHGARLLAACVDLSRDGGYSTLHTWASADDEARTRFLNSAGFGPTGPRRTLGALHGEVVEHLWRTAL